MRRILVVAAIVAAIAIPFAVHAKEAAKAAKAPVTMTGEIVDTGCFLDHGARGAKHKDCATKCLAGGMPAALLTDKGELILLLMDHDKPELMGQVKDLAAEKVSITGKVSKGHGMTAMYVSDLKKEEAK